MLDRPTLTLRPKPVETPNKLRFIERKGRYILQELIDDLSRSAASVVRWRDVPLVRTP